MHTGTYDPTQHARALYVENLRLRELLTLVAQDLERLASTNGSREPGVGRGRCWCGATTYFLVRTPDAVHEMTLVAAAGLEHSKACPGATT